MMSISASDDKKIVRSDIDRKAYKADWYQKNKKRINASNRQYLRDYRKRKKEEAREARIAAANAGIERIEKMFAAEAGIVLEFGGRRPKVVFGGYAY